MVIFCWNARPEPMTMIRIASAASATITKTPSLK
jgi:hypothetical protein